MESLRRLIIIGGRIHFPWFTGRTPTQPLPEGCRISHQVLALTETLAVAPRSQAHARLLPTKPPGSEAGDRVTHRRSVHYAGANVQIAFELLFKDGNPLCRLGNEGPGSLKLQGEVGMKLARDQRIQPMLP